MWNQIMTLSRSNRLIGHSLRLTLMASVCALSCGAALAQEAAQPSAEQAAPEEETGNGGDIVVTAQKRKTDLQATPLAMSALSGDTLAERQISSVESLATSLPNINFGRNAGIGRIAIRGLGLDTTSPGQEGRVAYHLDGVYISRPTATLGTFFDVERVEVVRGPQGTLYGRNATAGAINIITADPGNTINGFGRVTVGNYNLVRAEAGIGGPVSETLGARFAIEKVDRSGFGDNPTTGTEVDNEHTISARAKLRWEPSTAFDLTLSADYRNEDDHNYVYHYFGAGGPGVTPLAVRLGGQLPTNPRDSNEETPTLNNREFYGFGAQMNLDIGGVTLTSVTGYRHGLTRYDSDIDNTSLVIGRLNLYEKAEQFSEELRLAGDFSGGEWLLGAFYFDEKIAGFTRITPLTRAIFGGPQTSAQGLYTGGNLQTKAYAVFGQARYEFAPGLSLSVGARYSHERKSTDEGTTGIDLVNNYDPSITPTFRFTQRDSISFNSFTPRVGLEYQANPDLLFYATWSKGFKSGGYNVGTTNPPYFPEKLTDYEAGIKADWLDGALRTNLSVFYYDYTNLQVQKVILATTQIVNAASAEVKGIEAEVTIKPVDGFQIEANLSLLDSTYKNFKTADPSRPRGPDGIAGTIEQAGDTQTDLFDLAGNRLSQAPRYTISLAAQYRIPVDGGAFTLRAEGMWVDRVFFSPFNRTEVSQGAHSKFNAFLNFESDVSGLTASLFVRNIGNKRILSSAQVSSGLFGFPILGSMEAPRTYGVTLGYRF